MLYGYVRISTPKQSIDRQIRNIKAAYPDACIFQEVYTGTKQNRKEWNKLISRLKEKDTVVFDSVSRMSRNAEEGYTAYEELFDKGIELVFLKEHYIDTATFKSALNTQVALTGTAADCIIEGINKYLLILAKEQIRIAFEQAEKEVLDLQQRTREGIQTARAAGKQIGQREGARLTTKKSIAAKEIILKNSKAFNGSNSDKEVMILAGISKKTFYKYKRELREQIQDE